MIKLSKTNSLIEHGHKPHRVLEQFKSLIKYLIVGTLALAVPSYAVLPPYYEGVREITAILNDEDVANKITSGRVLEKIEKTDQGYRITANDCTLNVLVDYVAPKGGFVGPAQFEISAGKLVCENSENKD